MTTTRTLIGCFIALSVAVTLSGCGVLSGLFGGGVVFGGTRSAEFSISSNLNDNHPVAVELVVIYNADLDKEIGSLQARQWFAKRDQYLRDFSNELDTFRWEWTPGQSAGRQPFSYRAGARSAVIFVDYASPGEHRVRVEPPSRNLRLNLRAADFTVETL